MKLNHPTNITQEQYNTIMSHTVLIRKKHNKICELVYLENDCEDEEKFYLNLFERDQCRDSLIHAGDKAMINKLMQLLEDQRKLIDRIYNYDPIPLAVPVVDADGNNLVPSPNLDHITKKDS